MVGTVMAARNMVYTIYFRPKLVGSFVPRPLEAGPTEVAVQPLQAHLIEPAGIPIGQPHSRPGWEGAFLGALLMKPVMRARP